MNPKNAVINQLDYVISALLPENTSTLTKTKVFTHLLTDLTDSLNRKTLSSIAAEYQPCDYNKNVILFHITASFEPINLIRDYSHEFGQLIDNIFSQLTQIEYNDIVLSKTYSGMVQDILLGKRLDDREPFGKACNNALTHLISLLNLDEVDGDDEPIYYLNFSNVPNIDPDNTKIESFVSWIKKDNPEKTVYFYTYDAWGNYQDGYQVNDVFLKYTIPTDALSCGDITDLYGIEFEIDENSSPDYFEITQVYTGKCIGRLEIRD